MDIAKIKQMVSIPDFLNFLGCVPTDHKDGRYLHYRSPLREDNKPSFWVDTQKGICGDFNGDRIGDVINLAERYYNCDFKTAAANIADSFRLGAFSSANKHTAAQPTIPATKDTTIHIKHIQPLQNVALLQYVQERKISIETAKRYLQEAYYKTSDSETARQYFALAFKNDKGGYELRSKYYKGSTPLKTVTTIKQGSDTVVVFEGFMTFLSCVEYWNSLNKTIPYDVIILNSLSNINKANYTDYATIKLMLDADKPGHTATDSFMAQYPNAINIMPKFIPYEQAIEKKYKDFNDYWVKKC